SKGGTEEPSNLVACCKRCNMRKTNRTPEEAGMKFWDGFDATQLVTPNVTLSPEDEEDIEVEVDVASTKKTKQVIAAFELSSLEELIYADYPRKVGRADALKSIGKAIGKIQKQFDLAENEAAEYLHKAVLEYAKSPAGNRGNYTPHPATWMNQERWNDDRAEWYRSEEVSSGKQQTYAQRNQQSVIDAVRAANAADSGVDSQGTGTAGDPIRPVPYPRTIDAVQPRPRSLPAASAGNRVQTAKAGVDS